MVALPASIVVALRSHKARRSKERLLAGESWTEAGFVFTSEIGSPMDGSNVTRRFQQLLANAGLPRLRFHDLRHDVPRSCWRKACTPGWSWRPWVTVR
jgi:integrase